MPGSIGPAALHCEQYRRPSLQIYHPGRTSVRVGSPRDNSLSVRFWQYNAKILTIPEKRGSFSSWELSHEVPEQRHSLSFMKTLLSLADLNACRAILKRWVYRIKDLLYDSNLLPSHALGYVFCKLMATQHWPFNLPVHVIAQVHNEPIVHNTMHLGARLCEILWTGLSTSDQLGFSLRWPDSWFIRNWSLM